jgi:hypothetical protein
MANDVRGEVSFTADGKPYTIKFSTNGICSAERILGKSLVTASTELDWITVRRTMLWAALNCVDPLTKRPINGKTFSEDEAGEIMDGLPAKDLIEVLLQAMSAAYPAPAEGKTDRP